MNNTHFGGRVRAALIGGVIAAATLAGTAFADQTTTTTQQTPHAIGPHTHQIHGTVSVAPAATTTSSTAATAPAASTPVTFTVNTARYGAVVVSFAGRTIKGEGHGRKARAFDLAS